MRLAVLIVSLVLALVFGIQSCAVTVGGSLSESLSTTEANKKQGEAIAGTGAVGLLAALVWLVAAALVIGRPRISMWLFGVAVLLCLAAGASGFSDAYYWAVASVILAAMSWRGTKEKASKDEQERARYEADVATAAAAIRAPDQPSG